MYSKSKVKRWYRLFMPRSVSIATLPGSHLQCPVFFYAQVETLKPKRSLSCSSYLVWSFYILYFLTLQCLTAAVDDPWPIGQGSQTLGQVRGAFNNLTTSKLITCWLSFVLFFLRTSSRACAASRPHIDGFHGFYLQGKKNPVPTKCYSIFVPHIVQITYL